VARINAETGNYVYNVIFTLAEFSPAGDIVFAGLGLNNVNAIYALTASDYTQGVLVFQQALYPDLSIVNFWFLTYIGAAEGDVCYKADTSRALPVKNAGNADGWVQLAGNVENVIIQPVTDALTPWEFRRRRLLELC
jgi:hypothetical protein